MSEQTYVTVAMASIGLGAVLAGIVGMLFLPKGEQLSAVLALMVGAGIGLASLFILLLADADSGREPEQAASSFMIAAFLGLGGVVASLALLVRRTRDGGDPRGAG